MLAAVVVTHSAPPGTLASCLAALVAAGDVERVIVVDNGAAGTLDLAAVDAAGPLVELVQVPNRGYGAAANVGFGVALRAGAIHVALLNDDVVVRPAWTAPLLAELIDPEVGAAQPKLLTAGTNPPQINSLGVTIGGDGAGTDIGFGTLDVVVAGSSDLERFTGGAVMFSKPFLEATGGFDERWFLYYEDTDLAARGRALGWRYRLAPGSVVEHAGGVTTSRDWHRTRYLQERNRLRHAFRHCDVATITRAVWLSIRRLRHPPRGVHTRALVAGLMGAPGAFWRRARGRNVVLPRSRNGP
jgi:N-acetylglucosaminyl-diphospho-decaprenol L-rhamnosyltransferase